jgi:hypothetical protein
MAKKIKTFTVDEQSYDALMAIFRESKVETSVSHYLDKYVKELLAYFRAIKEGLEDSTYTVPFSFIIDSVAKMPTVKLLDNGLAGGSGSLLSVELDEWQKQYEEKTRKELKFTVDPEVYDRVSKAAKKYGVKDFMSFLFKVMLEQAKKGRELSDDEYKALRKSMSEGYEKYRKDKVIPAFDKIDDKLDKVLKPFGLKMDRGKEKK